MKRAIITVLALVVSVLGYVGLSPQAAYAAPICSKHMSSARKDFGNVLVTGIVYYRICKRSAGGRSWVRLDSAIGKYSRNSDGPCGWSDAFDGATFDFYFWDNLGRNYNPSTFTVGCAPGKRYNSRSIGLGNAPRLFFRDGAPHWKANVSVKWGWAVPDEHATIGGRLDR
jgi:hypothetical protein